MVVIVVALVWIVLSLLAGLVLGSAIRRADHRALLTGLPADLTVADILGARAAEPSH